MDKDALKTAVLGIVASNSPVFIWPKKDEHAIYCRLSIIGQDIQGNEIFQAVDTNDLALIFTLGQILSVIFEIARDEISINIQSFYKLDRENEP